MKGGKKRSTAKTGPGDPASHEDIGTPGDLASRQLGESDEDNDYVDN